MNKKKILALTLACASIVSTALANPTHSEGYSEGVSHGSTYSNGHITETNCGHSEAYSTNYSEGYSEGMTDEGADETVEKSVTVNPSCSTDEYTEDKILVGNNTSPKIGLELRYFSPKLNGSIQSDAFHAYVGSINVRDDLGIRNTIPSDIKLLYDNLSLEWLHSHNIGNTNTDIVFNNKNYGINSKVKTNIDYFKFNVSNKLYSNNKVDIHWTYGASVYRVDANIENNINKNSKVLTLPVPTIGLTAQTNFNYKINAYIDVSGLPLGGYGNVFDIESGLKYTPIDNMSISAGYRILHSSAHKDDKDASFRMAGPFVGIMYAF